MTIRTLGTAAAIAAAWTLAAAGAAAGQTADPPPPPGTLVLGPVRITPGLLLKDMGIDNNVFNAAVDPKRDFTFTLTPRAAVLFRMRRLRLGLTTSTDYVYYRTYTSERGTNTSAVARADLDLGILKPYVTASAVSSRNRINAEIDARARHRDAIYAGGLTLKVASRTNVLLNATHGEVAYEPDEDFRGISLRDSLDGTRDSVDTGIAIALTPLTTFSVIAAREWQRFEFSRNRESDAWRVSPTFTFSPTGLLSGTASVGYRRFHTRSAELADYSGLVSAVSVSATIYDRNQVLGVFNRDVQYSYDTTTAFYLGTAGTVTWTYLLAGPIDVRGTAGRTLMNYSVSDASAGRDTTTLYGGGLGYRFSNHARFGVNAEWSRRASTRSADRNYRNNRIFAGLTWGTTS
jgi:hypothetical protein